MQDTTTLVCLFHHEKIAQATLEDLLAAGVPSASVSIIDNDGPREENSGASLEALGVPARDQRHLLDGLRKGGVIVAVSSIAAHENLVEAIFKKHSATQIDEIDRNPEISDDLQQASAMGAPLNTPIPLGDVRTLRMYRSDANDRNE